MIRVGHPRMTTAAALLTLQAALRTMPAGRREDLPGYVRLQENDWYKPPETVTVVLQHRELPPLAEWARVDAEGQATSGYGWVPA